MGGRGSRPPHITEPLWKAALIECGLLFFFRNCENKPFIYLGKFCLTFVNHAGFKWAQRNERLTKTKKRLTA